jgi:cardiolipin synthase
MTLLRFFIDFLLPPIGFVLALILLAHVLKQRRSPSTTLAWLMAIVFVPYVGVPLYILLGGRKMSRMAETKPILTESGYPPIDRKALVSDARVFPGGFPATKGNKAMLLTSGDQAFSRIMALIRSAEKSIHITTYILGRDATGDSILEALTQKAARGVKVYLLLDALGSMHIRQKHLGALKRAGGKAAFFMPMLRLPFRGRANLRNHRKMVLVDHSRAIVGGRNLTRKYMGSDPGDHYWLDFSVQIEGPSVAHILQLFQSDWLFAAGEELPEIPPESHALATLPGHTLQFAASGPDVVGDTLREELLAAFFRARHRIWIMTPYFVPDDLVLESLCIAAKRGIDLRIVVPARSNHPITDLVREAYLSQLQESGANILLYDPGMMHAKAFLIDDRVAITGSVNMDMRSLLLNYEAALCVYSRELIYQFDAWMRAQMVACRPRKRRTGTALGILEGMARLVAPLL